MNRCELTKLLTVLCIVLLLAGEASGGDWPMWRYDAARSNASPHALPQQLRLQWERQLPAPRPAWPASQQKLQFDAVYQPIVVGKLMIVSSTVNDSVTAFDTATGNEVWRFFTDGPVRFAPVAHRGKVYAASDDGCLYCLAAETGKLIWKVLGGPNERRIIGNERLVSSWPIRGGPVIVDETVYFTASIWPFMGIFIHAVEAETGETVWMNSETGSRWVTHPHGAPSFGSIVPQGYLATIGDRLLIPGGRSLPGVFDRRTGEMERFEFGGKGDGGWNITAHKDFYVVNNTAFAMSDGTSLGSVPVDAIANGLLIGKMTAYSLDHAVRIADARDRKGKEIKKLQFKPAKSFPVSSPDLPVLAVAGKQAFTGRKRLVASFDIEAAERNGRLTPPTWSAEIAGSPVAMLAGDDKLFVVTQDSRVYCFGGGDAELKRHDLPQTRTPTLARSDFARAILADGNAAPGYAIVHGIGSGKLIAEIVSASELQIIAIDSDEAKVDRLRREMDVRGLYGTRVVAHLGDPASFYLPPYMAKVMFSDALQSMERGKIPQLARSAFDALRPYGGVASWQLTEDQHDVLANEVANDEFPNAELSRKGNLSFLRRVGPLPGSGTWTHQYADAANSVVSQDSLVKAPLGLLWFGGPPNDKVLPRHGHGPSPQVAGGRLVIEGADMLRCVDVYTGRVLWERDLPGLGTYYNTTKHFPGAGEIGSNYVTLPDAVYVVYREALLQLDAANGRTMRRFTFEQNPKSPPAGWGYLAADGDFLVATSSPVAIRGEETAAAAPKLPDGLTPVIKPGTKWTYLAGKDPVADWTSLNFKPAAGWKVGAAGFGYGDGDDRTELTDMKGKYSRVYARREFAASELDSATRVVLAVNYDDAFIAYLNGKEIVRKGVSEGHGAEASGVTGHEANGYESFELKAIRKLLRPGKNVLALEGHNVGPTSSDFTLDPVLLIDGSKKPPSRREQSKARGRLADVLSAAEYSSSSRQLVVMNRHDGKVLWTREAVYSFRHNAIVVANNRVFCIDGLSEPQRQTLRRRGLETDEKPQLLALDASTGKELWSTTEDVFGTFLNYSQEHDILLQAGSAYRDRAKDESSAGMVAYRGRDGAIVWKDLTKKYNGPCLLLRDKIITNGGGGFELDLLTGENTGWNYKRMYGCNTAVGSQNLLTFRSGAAGFCDLAGDSGTGNIGGFRSSCTANLIVADGVLNAPDYTRTCSCAYQNQSSLALVHMPEAEQWTFSNLKSPPETFAVNLGAPGDRRGPDDVMWYDQPSVGGSSPKLPFEISGEIRSVRHHSTRVGGDETLPWVASSAIVGVDEIEQKLEGSKSKRFTVRLYFAELERVVAGQRVFDVAIQDERVLSKFDVVRETGGPLRGVVKEFTGIVANKSIEISFDSKVGEACLSGVQIIPEGS
jgi:outer membrane protein assembly factor BamB